MKHVFFAVVLFRSACDPEPPTCIPERSVDSPGGVCQPYQRYICDINEACERQHCRCFGGNEPIGPGPIVSPVE